LAATLANARLAIWVVLFILAMHIVRQFRRQRSPEAPSNRKRLAISLCILLLCAAFSSWFYSSDPYALDRLLESASTESSGNIYRLFYWESGYDFFSHYTLIHKLFGSEGAWRDETGFGAAESDWLTLLMNTGIAGAAVYLLPFAYLCYLALAYDKWALPYLAIPFFVTMINPVILLPLGGVFYWLFVFYMHDSLESRQRALRASASAGSPTTGFCTA